MFCLPPTSRPRIAVDQRGVALDVALARDLAHASALPSLSRLLVDHFEQPEPRPAASILLRRQIPPSARRRRLRADVIDLRASRAGPALTTRRADAAGLRRLRLEHVPVRDEHVPLREIRHQVRRHEIARAIEARLARAADPARAAGCGSSRSGRRRARRPSSAHRCGRGPC